MDSEHFHCEEVFMATTEIYHYKHINNREIGHLSRQGNHRAK